MVNLADISKRLLVGRAKHSDQLGETLLPKRLALPVFASDAMSSVAYATQEILIILALAGTAWLSLTPWAAAGVVVVLATVVTAYRQNVHAYPSGGGDYEVANTNLGPQFGLIVAAALLVDYVLTVAVSTSAGVENLASTPAFGWMADHRVGHDPVRRGDHRAAQPARHPRVGRRLRGPDLRVHVRHPGHDRARDVAAHLGRRPAGADRRATRSSPSWASSARQASSSSPCAPLPRAVRR